MSLEQPHLAALTKHTFIHFTSSTARYFFKSLYLHANFICRFFIFEFLCSRCIIWGTFGHDPLPHDRESVACPPQLHIFDYILGMSRMRIDKDVIQLAVGAIEKGAKTVRNPAKN